MSKWDELSLADKAEMIGVAVKNGITTLPEIRAKYNEFAEGGSTDTDLVDRIIKEEGFNTKPENIGDGKITLGSGLTAKKWHDLYKQRGNKWSAADNRRAVTEEVASRRRWAERNIPNWSKLPDSSQKALLSYKYNYDFNRGNSPKLFAALEAGNLQEAARQMDATSKDPKFKKGLAARRQREQEWFLSDVTSKPVVASTIPFEQPISTIVVNPYVPQVENTRIAPVMIPDEDSYVTAHRLTEAEEKRQKFQERMEAISNFNRLLQMTSLDNTAVPAFMPTTGNTFLDSMMGLTKAEGGKIHIKDSKKGTFTAAASKHGKSVQEFASQVLAHKENYSPAMVKKANFARNSRKWKHGLGGNLFSGEEEGSQQMQIGRLSPYGGTWLPEVIVKASEDPMVIMARQNPKYRSTLSKMYETTKETGEDLLTKPQATRLLEVYNEAGRPKLYPLHSDEDRAYTIDTPLGKQKMFLSTEPNEGLNDLVAELAHPLQKKYGNNKPWKERLNPFYDEDDYRGKTRYDFPNKYEHETHEDFEPLLQWYIEANGLPGQRYITKGELGNNELIISPNFMQIMDSAKVYNKRKQDNNYNNFLDIKPRKNIKRFFKDMW